MRRTLQRCLLASMLLFAHAAGAFAAPGDLDPSFGAGGVASPAIPGDSAEAAAAVLQPDGNIVCGGIQFVSNPDLYFGSVRTRDFIVARFDSTGSLDPSFGSGGVATTNWGLKTNASIFDLVLQPDGKLVAAGSTAPYRPLNLPPDWGPTAGAVARYQPNGALDTSFGTGGKVSFGFGVSGGWVNSALVLPDGRLVFAGFANGTSQVFFARLLADGSMDPSFGSNGSVTLASLGHVTSLARQPDGKLVAAGSVSSSGSVNTFLVRLHPDGALDTGFGNGGFVEIDVSALAGSSGGDAARSLAILPDEKIITAGNAADRVTLVRFLADGALDTTFGTGGIASTTTASTAAGLVRTDAGDLVVSGTTFTGWPPVVDFVVARFGPDGDIDAGFGAAGSAELPILPNLYAASGHDVLLQPDQKLLTVGMIWSEPGPLERFALVRLLTNLAPPVPALSRPALLALAGLLAIAAHVAARRRA